MYVLNQHCIPFIDLLKHSIVPNTMKTDVEMMRGRDQFLQRGIKQLEMRASRLFNLRI